MTEPLMTYVARDSDDAMMPPVQQLRRMTDLR